MKIVGASFSNDRKEVQMKQRFEKETGMKNVKNSKRT